MKKTIWTTFAAAAAVAAWLPGGAGAAGKELNIYSARHYQTDEALYDEFTKKTGIKINRIEASGDKLMARLKSEGANSPADVFITVDAGNLWRADEAGLFQPVTSAELEKRIPKNLRHPQGHWFGFSTRARVIVFNKAHVKDPAEAARYEDLAAPKWKGQVCIRSSSNMYNLSLMASLIEHLGEAKAEAWAKGVVANFAREPKGGDTDQIKAVAAGECALGLTNTYYYVRLMKSQKDADKQVVAKTGIVFPNQKDRGTHVNVSGAGVLKHAPNKANAVKFLEYLASDFAQGHFASGNNEYPVVATAKVDPVLASLGEFKSDSINVAVYGTNQPLAQKVYDRAAWK
jgi:iron(III) transport system substrate-binding protein